ncbi:MAG: SDR family oxidoreductase [Pseudomonadota bacterium]
MPNDTHASKPQGALRVMITAGAAGIGRAMAARFLEQGARVHVCDVDDAALEALATELPGLQSAHLDVSDEAAFDRWFDAAVTDLGGLDVMINNAGTGGPTGKIEDMDTAAWRQCFAVGVESHMFGCRRAVQVMKEQCSGSIVNISSVAGLVGYPLRTPYAASKWAVIGLTKSVAAEVGPFNIRCNAICPGPVSGPRMDRGIAAEAANSDRSEDEVRDYYASGVSMRRFVEPEEIADMALFLASPGSAMVTGQAICVDGHTETYH